MSVGVVRARPSRQRGARSPTRLQTARSNSAELDARLLTGAVLGLDLTGLITAGERGTLTRGRIGTPRAFARRRLAGEPVARILGHKEFWGLSLQLSPATLVPRPDTETVVELALEMLRADGLRDRPLRIADLGTGSGAILLALLSELPQAQGIGTDISAKARCKPPRQCGARWAWPIARRFIACDYAGGAVRRIRSDRVQSALYPLGGYRGSRRRGPRITTRMPRSTAAPTGSTPIAR